MNINSKYLGAVSAAAMIVTAIAISAPSFAADKAKPGPAIAATQDDAAAVKDDAPETDANAGAKSQPAAKPAADSKAAKADKAEVKDDAEDTSAASEPEDAQPQKKSEAPSDEAPASKSAKITASDVEIGQSVFGADGKKIGEVNRVTAGASGDIEEIHVTAGTPAGMNAKVMAIPGDKLSVGKDGVMLSLSAADAKKLPVIDDGSSG